MADNTIDTLALEIKSNANSAVNSINRLAEALGKLQSSIGGVDYASFANIGSGIRNMGNAIAQFAANVRTADFTRIATGLNKLAGVNVQGVSDASRAISTLTSNLNGMSNLSFDAQGMANLANSIAQLGRKTVTQAADNIPRLTTALSGLVTELNTLGAVNFDAASLSNLVASITKLGGKSATSAIPNIKALGIALKEMMAILSTAPNVSQNLIQMTQALAQLAASGGRVSSASNGLIGGLNGVGSAASRTKKHVFSLAAAFGKFYATYWLILRGFRLFKRAISISSDLTEVENVVNVTFSSMKQKVEDLAATSIQDFGMSELTVKQISSRFQAMGVAMGISTDQVQKASDFLRKNNNIYGETVDSMADVSIELTKLAADMASFYNVEQSMVAEKLSSIFTGQTRPLRDFGLDLTQATLQEWALKQGLDADIKSMSQAEKTMLRFQYVMQNSAASMGDFARTSGTWANQTRILAQSFEQLGSVIGGALINAFKPLVAWLNRAMQSVIAFAQTVVNALGKIFGWTYEIKNGGVSNDFEDAGVGAEEMADGTGAAKDNLEEMQKYIAPWHEVRNMTTKDDSDGGGGAGGGGAGGAGGGALAGQLVQTEGLLDKYKSDIDSLYELGKYISSVLSNAMESIDWNSIYRRAEGFGRGLADFLNGLINPRLFENVGKTVAGALNTALHFLDSFGERFDWKNFGKSIASGVNGFFNMFDFSLLARNINVWAKGILDSIIAALDNIEWGMIGKKIGKFLLDIDFVSILGKVGKAIWKALNGAFEVYQKTFETAPLETALLSLVGVTKLLKVDKFQKLISVFSKGFTVIGKFFGELSKGSGVLGSLMVTFPKFGSVVNVLNTSFLIFYHRIVNSMGVLTGLKASFGYISESLTAVQKGFIGITAAFAEFAIFKNVTRDMALGTENMVSGLLKLAATAGIAGVALSAVFSFPVGAIAAGIIGLTGLLVGFNEAQYKIAENSSMGQFANSVSEASEEVARRTEQIKGNISSIKEESEAAGEFEAQRARSLADEYERLADITYRTGSEEMRMKDIAKELGEIIPGVSDYIDEQTGYLEIQKETLDDLINNMELYAKKQALQEMLTDSYKAQYDAQMNVARAQEDVDNALEKFINNASGMSQAVQNMVQKKDWEGIENLALEMANANASQKEFQEVFGEGMKNYLTVSKSVDVLKDSMGGYVEVLDDAKAVQAETEDTTKRLYDSLMENNAALAEQEERNLALTRSSEEYQKSIRNLSYEFSELGTAVSDEFLDKLALNETGMADSVLASFSKMKEGIQLEAGELQMLFGNIAPGMSDSFVNSMVDQEPQMQLQIATTMANLSSGAEVSFEELKATFGVMGYEIPDEVIAGFQEKGPIVQSSVIGLLSEAKMGAGLIGPELMELFNGIGIGIPSEMLKSMESMDGPTQAQAIELLSQLISGCDMSSDEILRRFSEIGFAVPEVVQSAIESGNAETFFKAQGLLSQLSSAANEEEKKKIIAEYSGIGQGVLNEGIIAALEDENGEVRNAAVAVINEISSATTGEEKEAAISAANSFATEYVGEISETMTAQADSVLPEVGKHIVGGVVAGMTEDNGELATAAESVMSRAEGDLRKAGKIHSPSERMMPIGSYLLQGIIEGFTASIGQWTASITTWATETYNLFSSNITKTIADATAWFSELPGKIYTAIFPTNERVTTWGGEVFRTFQTNINNSIMGVVSWFSELPGKIYKTIINFVTQTLPQWKGDIDDFFGRAIPDVISNVVNLFGDLADALVPTGENLIRGLWNGIENLTDWLGSKIGGFCRNVIDTFKSGFDEHSPSKEAFEIGDFFTRGLQNGMADRFGDVYGDIKGFTESISSIKMTPPELDLSIPEIPDYKPRTYDMGTVQSKMQMEFDEKMAQMAYENQRTQEMLQQIIDAIDRKQLIVGDRDIFDANRRETLKFGRRTSKDPYPVYGRYK